ncbi:tRNA (cytosine(32)/uridine(32)-2'-O)-methyltransferase TrmJ [Psychromonas antarctica]|jgi:tRNA (cytidine32/uridine32-2'-O)-methyltransferase|uniref:tRNA (cytosine(32)/uridine(32)-2'-O)-methyltransferase TrmJ n=1 Tax=Psychromonas antarctica TaxID=67573 RepID=UPI001EE9189D|nr:tRNA (cytosine(32)/uridine(32)-2'-O)-methyltransferase TrmJ [Psychromonas antarctica]MCG6202346.1 tRNA (cytosine(32)/uridine(32)-2'-O)-methyltransferase TrmJ [Psychromonas antarctica]
MLDNVRIVLIGTSHPGNIGSAARAMKTMGLTNLVLVSPECSVDGKSVALSAGATDVLKNHKVCATLDEAIADCGLVIGASARPRTLDWPMLDPREMGEKAVAEGNKYPIALVFGRENSGLSNEELQKCHFHVFIPANPEYSSLNLAMAVQTLSYEIRMAFLASKAYPKKEREYPLAEELEAMFNHLQQTLIETRFIVPAHPGLVMNKLRRFFNRARPEIKELRMWRGIFSSIQKSLISANGRVENEAEVGLALENDADINKS